MGMSIMSMDSHKPDKPGDKQLTVRIHRDGCNPRCAAVQCIVYSSVSPSADHWNFFLSLPSSFFLGGLCISQRMLCCQSCCDVRHACFSVCGSSRMNCEAAFSKCTKKACEFLPDGGEARKGCDSAASMHSVSQSVRTISDPAGMCSLTRTKGARLVHVGWEGVVVECSLQS